MRVNAADVFQGGGVGQEVLADAQQHFAADGEGRGGEAVQRVGDHAFGGVFYRDDAVVAGAAFHRLEDVADGAHRPGAHGMTELFERGGLGEGAFRAEVGDFQRQFQGEAGGHDFPEQPHHFLVGQGACVQGGDALQHLPLAFGAVVGDLRAAFGSFAFADLLCAAGAGGEFGEDVGIKRVDLRAQFGKGGYRHGLLRFWRVVLFSHIP